MPTSSKAPVFEVDDVDDADQAATEDLEVFDDLVDEDEPPLPPARETVPPLRSKTYKPGHRQPTPTSQPRPSDSSWWMGKDRSAFTDEATKRAPEMSATKEGKSVKGSIYGVTDKRATGGIF